MKEMSNIQIFRWQQGQQIPSALLTLVARSQQVHFWLISMVIKSSISSLVFWENCGSFQIITRLPSDFLRPLLYHQALSYVHSAFHQPMLMVMALWTFSSGGDHWRLVQNGKVGNATFRMNTGPSNPFFFENVGIESCFSFIDVDLDGDQDAFISTGRGLFFFRTMEQQLIQSSQSQ